MTTLDDELLDKIQFDIDENETLAKLHQEYKINDILEFNEFNFSEKLKQQPFLSEQFRLIYLKEKHTLMKIEDIFEKKQGELYDHFKFEGEKPLTKTEIERYYLPKDTKLSELKKYVLKQQLRVDYFESVWKALEQLSWKMKLFFEADMK